MSVYVAMTGGMSNIQHGYHGNLSEGRSGWQRGWPFMSDVAGIKSGSRSYAHAPTNYTINNNYSIIPFLNSDKTSEFAFKMPLFSWGDEHQGILEEARTHLGIGEVRNKFDIGMKRPRTINGEPYMHINSGLQPPKEAILALNLPMLNWVLANYCNVYTTDDPDIELVHAIPDRDTIIKKIRPLGVCINSRSSHHDARGMSNTMRTDVRAITNSGIVDVFNLWAATKTGIPQLRLMPGMKLYFILVPEEVELNQISAGGSPCKTLNFRINESDLQQVQYYKKVVWKVKPLILAPNEQIDVEKHELSLYTSSKIYTGHAWKFGRITCFPSQKLYGDANVENDVCMDAKQIMQLSVVEIMCDYNGGQKLMY